MLVIANHGDSRGRGVVGARGGLKSVLGMGRGSRWRQHGKLLQGVLLQRQTGMELGQRGTWGRQEGVLGFAPDGRDYSTRSCCGPCRRARDRVLAAVPSRPGSNPQPIGRGTGARRPRSCVCPAARCLGSRCGGGAGSLEVLSWSPQCSLWSKGQGHPQTGRVGEEVLKVVEPGRCEIIV